MKTATIRVYQIHGTSDWCADIHYRKKLLKRFTKMDISTIESELKGVSNKAIQWAKDNSFTHYNLTLG